MLGERQAGRGYSMFLDVAIWVLVMRGGGYSASPIPNTGKAIRMKARI
jgi:hypothetical protein